SPMFVRDDNGQKAFSKLRSAIGGVYAWRMDQFRSGALKNQAEYQRMIKEADFAFKQAFAFCPYSPEAVFKYVNLLVNSGHADDADRVVETCILFDPENSTMHGLLQNIREIKKGSMLNMNMPPQSSV